MGESSLFTKLANRGIKYLYSEMTEHQEVLGLIRRLLDGKRREFWVLYRNLLRESPEEALKIRKFKKAYDMFPKIHTEILREKDTNLNEIYFSAFRLKIEQKFLIRKSRASINRYLMSLLRFSIKDKRYLRLFKKIIGEMDSKPLETLYSGIFKLLEMGFNKEYLIVKDAEKIKILDKLVKMFEGASGKISNLVFKSIMQMWMLEDPIKVLKRKTEIKEIDLIEIISAFRPVKVGKPVNYEVILEREIRKELKKLEVI